MCEKKGCCINCDKNCNSRCTYAGKPLQESRRSDIVIKREFINVSDIVTDGINPRQIINEESLNDFADSTDDKGFLQPIGVYRNNGTTKLIWGKRRVLAATKKNREKLEGIVYEGEMSQLDLLLLSLTENIHREPLTRKEERDAVNRLHTEHKLSVRDIAKRLRKGKSYVGDLIAETKYPEDVLKALDNGGISVKLANKISGIKEPGVRAKLIEKRGELYPEDVKNIGNSSIEKVEENLELIKADKFIKKQMDKLSTLFGNLTPDNYNETLNEIKTIAEQSHKPLIKYGFMEGNTFSECTEKEIETIIEGCTDEDKPVALKYVELNKHILNVVKAAENRIKSFKNPAPSEPIDTPADKIPDVAITIERGKHFSDSVFDEVVNCLKDKDSYQDKVVVIDTEEEVSAGRTVESRATDKLCDELTYILGVKTIYKGNNDKNTSEIHLFMKCEDIQYLLKKISRSQNVESKI
jgi:ParB/RepB/Spo0J family partition protein